MICLFRRCNKELRIRAGVFPQSAFARKRRFDPNIPLAYGDMAKGLPGRRRSLAERLRFSEVTNEG